MAKVQPKSGNYKQAPFYGNKTEAINLSDFDVEVDVDDNDLTYGK